MEMQQQKVSGAIVVHGRTELYSFGSGQEQIRYTFVNATYKGDIEGPAAEAFVAVEHPDGSQTHYGSGTFIGNVKGRIGTLVWKFKGEPGSGEIEIVSGTGEISALKGLVTYVVNDGSKTEFTYSGTLGSLPSIVLPSSERS
jgi:hypothetical protein